MTLGTVDQSIRNAENAVRMFYEPSAGTPNYSDTVESLRKAMIPLRTEEVAAVAEMDRLFTSTEIHRSPRALLSSRVLALIGGLRAAEALVRLALGPDVTVQSLALTGLRLFERATEVFDYLSCEFSQNSLTPGESLPRERLVEGLARQLNRERCDEFARLTLSHPSTFVRSVAVRALVQVGGNEAVPHLRAALRDDELSVRLWAMFGLILEGDANLLAELKRYADTPGRARAEAVSLIGLLPLPAIADSVFAATAANVPKGARLAAILRAGGIGTRESLVNLIHCLDDKNTTVVEQAAAALHDLLGHDPGYTWKGRRLTNDSVNTVKRVCQNRYSEWEANRRYLHGKLMTPHDLLAALRSLNSTDSASLFWTLVGMANQRFEYDPTADLIANWDSLARWAVWTESTGSSLQPGVWYFAGDKIDSHNKS